MCAAERKRNGPAVLNPEALRGDPDERLLPQELETVQARVVGQERQLQRAGGDLLGEFGRALADHRHLDQRMAAIEAREDLGEERFRVVVRDAEPDGASQPLSRQRCDGAGLDLDYAAGEVDQALSLGGQPRPAPLLDEQGAAKLLLEPADMHRNRRLGLVHPLGRLGERAGVDDGEERTQLVGVEHVDPSEIVIDHYINIRWTDQWLGVMF